MRMPLDAGGCEGQHPWSGLTSSEAADNCRPRHSSVADCSCSPEICGALQIFRSLSARTS